MVSNGCIFELFLFEGGIAHFKLLFLECMKSLQVLWPESVVKCVWLFGNGDLLARKTSFLGKWHAVIVMERESLWHAVIQNKYGYPKMVGIKVRSERVKREPSEGHSAGMDQYSQY